jgi:hypothetical protein
MVAVEQPRADCGHVSDLTQQCGKCLRWCCPECYAPWTALACGACRAEAKVAAVPSPYSFPILELSTEPAKDARCRSRGRLSTGPHRHREPGDVRSLAARVADLERLLQELRPRF